MKHRTERILRVKIRKLCRKYFSCRKIVKDNVKKWEQDFIQVIGKDVE